MAPFAVISVILGDAIDHILRGGNGRARKARPTWGEGVGSLIRKERGGSAMGWWLLVASMAVSAQVDAKNKSASPYTVDPVVDTILTVGPTLFLILADGLVKQELRSSPSCEFLSDTGPCDPTHLNGLDQGVVGNDSESWRTASNVGIGFVYGMPLVLGLLDSLQAETESPFADWGKDLWVVAEAGLLTLTITSVAKYAMRRPRPTQYHHDMPNRFGMPEHQLSFPSGHASVAAAVSTSYAMTYGLRHPDSAWRWLVYAGAGALTGLTAYARVAAGMHFYTDVLAGAVLGACVGVLVPWFHRAEVTLIPTIHAGREWGRGVQGITLSMKL